MRLALAMLECPYLWPRIVQSCSEALVLETFDGLPEVDVMATLRLWGRALRSTSVAGAEELLKHGLPTERHPGLIFHDVLDGVPIPRAEALRRLTHLAVERRPTPERETALAVLERWPAGYDVDVDGDD